MKQTSMADSVRWDRTLIAAASSLCLISIVALSSASATLSPTLVIKQTLWIGVGILASLLVASMPYPRWLDVSLFLYGGVMVLLLGVLLVGPERSGASRWIVLGALSIQPSELTKVATGCLLARYLAAQPTPLPLRSLVISAGVVGLPALLIFLQPDFGTACVLGAMWFGMIWVAGLSRRHLVVMGAAGLALLPVGWHLLKDYQRMRLLVFVNPHADPLGAGYTLIQSTIAIGSGQLLGRGWMAGTQNQLNFLPERHTDFIYSAIGEEWGFAGSVLVILLFGVFVWRAIRIALQNSDPQGRLVATAIVSWFGFQAVVNMGMAMGLLPVVGVPLPLVSYGGSAMLTGWLALGLLQSVHRFGTRF